MFVHRLTEDAELRLLEPRHAQELFSLIDRNRERLRTMPFVDYATSVDAERDFVKRSLHQFADGRGFECGLWYCGKLSGGIGMFPIDLRNRSTALGYWLDEEAEGKGLVTTACRAIISYLFSDLDVNRIVIRTIPANTRSKAVAARLGFIKEGTHRQLEMLRGEFVDVEIFSLLKQDATIENDKNGMAAFFTSRIDENTELAIFEPRHAQELFTLIDQNREHLRPWLAWVDKTESVDDMRAFIKKQPQQLAEDGTIAVGIWHSGALAGLIGLHSISAKCMQIGYWLGKEYQGKGLVTSACKAMISYAFDELCINRLELQVQPKNDRSRAVAQRFGFTYEGTLRQKLMNADGNLGDLMIYSLLKKEWGAC